MQGLLGAPIASESEATCDDCAMCQEREAGSRGLTFFRPEVKCCTYLPDLPNFLVGRILLDESPGTEFGRASIAARIDAGLAVSPLGLTATELHKVLYRSGANKGFGRAQALRCPHYIEAGGLCGVWRHRNHVCATWFCKHVRGAVGALFWENMRDLLGQVEMTLSRWCVLELGLEPDGLRRLAPDTTGTDRELDARDLDGVPDDADLRRMWGRWRDREREFYIEAARLVEPLAWDDVVRIGGQELRFAAVLTADSHAKATSDELPERLVPGKLDVTPLPGGMTRVASYRPYDPLSLPNEVLGILQHFDGRPTAEVLASLARDEGIEVERDLILQLADFRILVPPPDADATP